MYIHFGSIIGNARVALDMATQAIDYSYDLYGQDKLLAAMNAKMFLTQRHPVVAYDDLGCTVLRTNPHDVADNWNDRVLLPLDVWSVDCAPIRTALTVN